MCHIRNLQCNGKAVNTFAAFVIFFSKYDKTLDL